MDCASLSLLGSCVSTGPYYRIRPSNLNLAAYRTGTSIVSMMASPLRLESSDLESLEPFQCRQVEGDITKSALDCVTTDADFFVIDFGDETCDLVRIGATYVTHSNSLRQSGFLRRFPGHEILRRQDPATTRLWLDACDRFCRGPLARIPQDRIVFHQVQLADGCERTPTSSSKGRGIAMALRGILPLFRRLPAENPLRRWVRQRLVSSVPVLAPHRDAINLSDQAELLNPVLKTYSDHLRQLLPGAHVIDVPASHRLADRQHRFGVSGLHYLESYDRWFISALQARVYESGSFPLMPGVAPTRK